MTDRTTVRPSGAIGNANASPEQAPLVYQRIKSELLKGLGPRWPVGSRLPPLQDLAAELGAGKTNTHRALKELVNEGFLAARRGSGTYVRRRHDAKLAQRTHPGKLPLAGKRVGILRGAADAFVFPAVDAVTEHLSSLGCSITFGNLPAGRMKVSEAIEESRKADAVVLINPNDVPPLDLAPGQAVAVITTSMQVPLALSSTYDAVVSDSEQGGFLAGQWMRAIGCKSIFFVGVNPKWLGGRIDATCAARLRGFEMGFGVCIPDSLKFRAHYYQTTFGASAAAQFLELSPRPQGVFAASDDLALGFIHGALSHRLKPGKDYQIVGFDGQLRCRESADWPLTTIEVPMGRMGQMAAKLLVERLAEPRQPSRRLLVGNELFQGATAVARTHKVKDGAST